MVIVRRICSAERDGVCFTNILFTFVETIFPDWVKSPIYKFKVVHFPCNSVTYVQFKTNLLHDSSCWLINTPSCFCLNC